MKHLKNKALMTALACIILSVSACGGAPASETKETPENVTVTDTSESADTSANTAAENSDASSSSDTSESSESAGSTDSENTAAYKKGSWNGNVYTNSTLGLTFTLPDGWMIADEENIEQTVGGNEAVGGNDKKDNKKDKKNESPYDFMIVNAQTNANILLLAEDVSTAMGGSGMTENDYLTTIKSNLLSGQQTSYTPGEITTAVIAGETYSKMEVKVLYNGYTSLTQTYYCKKVGSHMLSFIASEASAANPDGTPAASVCQPIFDAMTKSL